MIVARYGRFWPQVTLLLMWGATGPVVGCTDPRFDTSDAAVPDGGPSAADAGLYATGGDVEAGLSLDGGEIDAEPEDAADAMQPEEDALVPAGPCLDDESVLGGECPNVVMCTSEGLCDLTRNTCCVTQTEASCSPALNCGTGQRLRCDGPEDCGPGKECCAAEGATSCVTTGTCPAEGYVACHTDSDCVARRCLEGVPGMFGPFYVVYFAKAGVCRGL